MPLPPPPPTHVFIQLGSNDLVSTKNLDLIYSIEGSIYRLRLLLPDVTIIWSDILQRCFWYGARNQKKINQTRRRVNTAAHHIIRPEGGKMLRHPTIVAKESSLFRPDGTPSPRREMIFTSMIYRGGLENFLTTNVDTFPPVNKALYIIYVIMGCIYSWRFQCIFLWLIVGGMCGLTTHLADSGIPTWSQSSLRPGLFRPT